MAFSRKGSVPAPAKTTAAKKTVKKSTTTTGTKKAGAKTKTGSKTGAKKTAAKPKTPTWTDEQVKAGTKIQAHMRGYLSRKHEKERKDKEIEMAAEMEKLRQAAWMAQVEYERKQAEKARKAAQEEARRRKEEARLRKALLEAAFDGEDDDVTRMLAEGEGIIPNVIDTDDAHGNTLLSEAAAGGALSTLKLLLARNADPNTQGEFSRTPLWRAAFMGKADCVAALLEAGGDPRIGNEGGEQPVHVASSKEIKAALAAWDIAATDRLVADIERRKEKRAADAAAEKMAALKMAEDDYESTAQAAKKAQQKLKHARGELEKRIFEHDTCCDEKKGEELIKVTLQHVQDQEAVVEKARIDAAAATEKLELAKLKLRESQAANGEEEELAGLPVSVRDLDDVLLKDVGDRLRNDGRWPLVVDVSGQASVYLRYMDSNYVNLLSPHATEPTRLRRSLLGAIRYGKPLVLDMMDVDLWDELHKVFDVIQPNLYKEIMSRTLFDYERYMSLVRDGDGEEYSRNNFQEARIAAFKLIVHTAQRSPPDEVVEQYYTIRVKVAGS